MTNMLYSALAGSIAPVKSKDNLNVYHVTGHQNTTQHFIMVTTHQIYNTSTMLNLLLLLSHNPQCENERKKNPLIQIRPERWIVTIPSSDQWLATIGNHWKTIATNGFGDQKPS